MTSSDLPKRTIPEVAPAEEGEPISISSITAGADVDGKAIKLISWMLN